MAFEALTAYLDSLQELGIPGADLVIRRGDRVIYRHAAGCSDAQGTKPVSDRDVYWLYSATKVITCTAALQLVEQGKLDLDANVCDYLPAFSFMTVNTPKGPVPAKNALLVRHLFTMCGGLNYDMRKPTILRLITASGAKATTRQVIDALACEPLDFEPGTHWQYSLCHDVIGALIEAVSGVSFGQYLQQHIFQPLGMQDTSFHPGSELLARMSQQYTYKPEEKISVPVSNANSFFVTPAYESGGATLCSTVDDYGRFVGAMSNGGSSADGARILRGETLRLMAADQLSGPTRADFDKLGRSGYSYALGVRTLVEKENSGAKSPLGEFGWDGAAGAYALIDTQNRVGVFYAQHVLNCGVAYSTVHPRLRDLVYEGLAQLPADSAKETE